jgi:hypothetical protein
MTAQWMFLRSCQWSAYCRSWDSGRFWQTHVNRDFWGMGDEIGTMYWDKRRLCCMR